MNLTALDWVVIADIIHGSLKIHDRNDGGGVFTYLHETRRQLFEKIIEQLNETRMPEADDFGDLVLFGNLDVGDKFRNGGIDMVKVSDNSACFEGADGKSNMIAFDARSPVLVKP